MSHINILRSGSVAKPTSTSTLPVCRKPSSICLEDSICGLRSRTPQRTSRCHVSASTGSLYNQSKNITQSWTKCSSLSVLPVIPRGNEGFVSSSVGYLHRQSNRQNRNPKSDKHHSPIRTNTLLGLESYTQSSASKRDVSKQTDESKPKQNSSCDTKPTVHCRSASLQRSLELSFAQKILELVKTNKKHSFKSSSCSDIRSRSLPLTPPSKNRNLLQQKTKTNSLQQPKIFSSHPSFPPPLAPPTIGDQQNILPLNKKPQFSLKSQQISSKSPTTAPPQPPPPSVNKTNLNISEELKWRQNSVEVKKTSLQLTSVLPPPPQLPTTKNKKNSQPLETTHCSLKISTKCSQPSLIPQTPTPTAASNDQLFEMQKTKKDSSRHHETSSGHPSPPSPKNIQKTLFPSQNRSNSMNEFEISSQEPIPQPPSTCQKNEVTQKSPTPKEPRNHYQELIASTACLSSEQLNYKVTPPSLRKRFSKSIRRKFKNILDK